VKSAFVGERKITQKMSGEISGKNFSQHDCGFYLGDSGLFHAKEFADKEHKRTYSATGCIQLSRLRDCCQAFSGNMHINRRIIDMLHKCSAILHNATGITPVLLNNTH
jgi:hypothetical protein